MRAIESFRDITPRSTLKKNYFLEMALQERDALKLKIKLIEAKIVALDQELKDPELTAGQKHAREKVRKSSSESWDFQNRKLKALDEKITSDKKKQVFG